MTSRDGFEVVNGLARRMLGDEVTRRAFLRAVGGTGAAAALSLGVPGAALGQVKPKAGGTIKKVEFGEAVVAHGPISPPMTGFSTPRSPAARTASTSISTRPGP